MLTILQEEQFENLYQLMEDSFPSDKYRPYQIWTQNIVNKKEDEHYIL